MDSLELIARENEFKKLNKQLEKKTESLMKEIQQAMQKQDVFTEVSQNLTSNLSKTRKHFTDIPKLCPTPIKAKDSKTITYKNNLQKHSNAQKSPIKIKKNEIIEQTNDSECKKNDNTEACGCVKNIVCDCFSISQKRSDDEEFLHAFVSLNIQDKILPVSFGKGAITVQNVCKFLSSKVKLLQEELVKQKHAIERKTIQCEKHLTCQAELESERMTLLNKYNSVLAESADFKAKWQAAQNRLTEKDRLYRESRSENDKIVPEVKRLRATNAGLEARCAQFQQTIDSLAHQLEVASRAEKEFRESTRSLSRSHETAISRSENRIKVLTLHIDKQNALIENLKKQNAILTAKGALEVLENKYSTFLKEF